MGLITRMRLLLTSSYARTPSTAVPRRIVISAETDPYAPATMQHATATGWPSLNIATGRRLQRNTIRKASPGAITYTN